MFLMSPVHIQISLSPQKYLFSVGLFESGSKQALSLLYRTRHLKLLKNKAIPLYIGPHSGFVRLFSSDVMFSFISDKLEVGAKSLIRFRFN